MNTYAATGTRSFECGVECTMGTGMVYTEVCTESPEHQGIFNAKNRFSSGLWNRHLREFEGSYP